MGGLKLGAGARLRNAPLWSVRLTWPASDIASSFTGATSAIGRHRSHEPQLGVSVLMRMPSSSATDGDALNMLQSGGMVADDSLVMAFVAI